MQQCSTDSNAAKSLIVAANRLAQQATCEMTGLARLARPSALAGETHARMFRHGLRAMLLRGTGG
jgi:hypothetical protein